MVKIPFPIAQERDIITLIQRLFLTWVGGFKTIILTFVRTYCLRLRIF